MEPKINALENFLDWFADQEDIPLQTRRDFFEHVQATGGIDEKAMSFIEKSVAQVERKSALRANVIQEQLHTFTEVLETQNQAKQYSVLEITISSINNWFQEKTEAFKEKAQNFVLNTLKSEETNEHESDLNQVAALKAAL